MDIVEVCQALSDSPYLSLRFDQIDLHHFFIYLLKNYLLLCIKKIKKTFIFHQIFSMSFY